MPPNDLILRQEISFKLASSTTRQIPFLRLLSAICSVFLIYVSSLKADNNRATSGHRTGSCRSFVQLLSSTSYIVVQFRTGHILDNNWTSTGQMAWKGVMECVNVLLRESVFGMS